MSAKFDDRVYNKTLRKVICFIETNKLSEAIEIYELLAEESDFSARQRVLLYNYSGYIYFLQNDFDKVTKWFKKVVAIKGDMTMNDICRHHRVAPSQVYAWKK